MRKSADKNFGLEPPEPAGPPEGVELVDLANLEPEADAAELSDHVSTDPETDSPGDDAILEQEELYEGISSQDQPSGKRNEN